MAWYGHQLDVEQQRSQVQFATPRILEMFGVAAIVIGLLLIVLGVIGRRTSR